jgi:hypothetical protein
MHLFARAALAAQPNRPAGVRGFSNMVRRPAGMFVGSQMSPGCLLAVTTLTVPHRCR